MGAAASVERALAAAPDQLSRAACDELAARHGVAVKDSLFDVLGAGNGTVAKAAVVRFCQLDALAHGTCGAAAAAPRTPKAARKTAREVVRRTLLAKGASRLSKGSDKGSSRLSDGSIDTLLAKGSSRLSNGTMDKASLDAVGEGRARRGTLPKEKDAPADVDGATVAPPQRRRTPSMYLGGAPRESESEKRLRESIRALGAETRIRMELDRATAKERRQKRLEALRVQAEQALASLEELPEVEKRRVRNQGILALYTPENLVKREKIREDPRVENILGKWWAASLRYDDKDRDEGLNRSEYAAWHSRLLALYAALGLDDDPLTDAEKNRILEEDFALDSGGAKVVDEEKFLHAVFQVADQWVENIDAAQYAEFLERAYDVVYRELVDADAIKPPDSWLTHLKGKAHKPWELNRTCEFAAEMYRLKLEGRGKPKVWGQTLGRFVLSHIKASCRVDVENYFHAGGTQAASCTASAFYKSSRRRPRTRRSSPGYCCSRNWRVSTRGPARIVMPRGRNRGRNAVSRRLRPLISEDDPTYSMHGETGPQQSLGTSSRTPTVWLAEEGALRERTARSSPRPWSPRSGPSSPTRPWGRPRC